MYKKMGNGKHSEGKHSEENNNIKRKGELGLHIIEKSFSRDIEETLTKLYNGSLRSGNRVEFEGSIIILGDVNAGAEVIAEDHIVVLGEIRGLAHAGAKGNKNAIIAANAIEAPQIRIANIVKEIERPESLEEMWDEPLKTKAYVENNEIVLE
ncbi:MAG: septum site-determining protein MinC [Clostridia bacterium]|nr:septum site-determining protein MinC [Clostridia bacterium]